MNQIMRLELYYAKGTWAFDDESTGLVAEPFVCGIPELIDILIDSAGYDVDEMKEGGVFINFSADEMPDEVGVLELIEEDAGGNWYELRGTERKGWLCPAMFKYFDVAPDEIHVAIQER